jgi:hypothetical protein
MKALLRIQKNSKKKKIHFWQKLKNEAFTKKLFLT